MHHLARARLPTFVLDAQLEVFGQLPVQSDVPEPVVAALQAVEHGKAHRRIGGAIKGYPDV